MKQNVAWNSYIPLIDVLKETNKDVESQLISKHCKKLKNICTQNKFSYPEYTVLRIKTCIEDSTYRANYFNDDIKHIGTANSIETAKYFVAIKMIDSLLRKDKKRAINLMSSLDNLLVTIQESSINHRKPSTLFSTLITANCHLNIIMQQNIEIC